MKKVTGYLEVDALRDNNYDVVKDIVLLVGSAAAVCAGVHGIVTFSQELINFYNSGEILKFGLQMRESLKFAGSASGIFFGGCGACYSGHKLKEDLNLREQLQEEKRIMGH